MTPEEETPLPFALPDVTDREIEAVQEVLRSRWLTTGARAHEFEKRFAERVGARHAVAVNSCTAALHLALEAVGVGAGDLVYVPTYTFAASAEVVRYLGATPVLVDSEPDTLNLDLAHLEQLICSDLDGARGVPRAVIPVHFAGTPCDMRAVWDLARRHGLAVVEDAAHAFPASRAGIVTGWMPEDVDGAVCFSFYATKTLTTGEGGMVTTQSEAIAERIRMMSLHGLSRQAWNRYTAGGTWRYDIVAPGYKYNLTDIAAAMGLVQLERAEAMRERRAVIADRYDRSFSDLPLQLPSVPSGASTAWHLYVVRVAGEVADERDRVIASLTEQGIGTSVHFIPLHLHTYYRNTWGVAAEDLPVASREFERVISLPIYSAMSDDDVARVIRAVHRAYDGGLVGHGGQQ